MKSLTDMLCAEKVIREEILAEADALKEGIPVGSSRFIRGRQPGDETSVFQLLHLSLISGVNCHSMAPRQ